MKLYDYSKSSGDQSLFYKHSNDAKVTILIIYINDIIITGNDIEERIKVEQGLIKELAVKNLGRMKYFLGIEISHSSHGLILSQ